ncbi:MAG TPA: MATE family efflux transporter, partial [Clostridia bacterium]|nr:MATE family efflux transporter [Clostridia bacterium]
ISQGAPALRLVIMMIPVIGVQIVGAALFQSLGKAVPSLVLSLLRQVLILIPLLIFLPRIGGLALNGIWISYPLADLLSTLLTGILIFKEMNKMKECEEAPAESACV